MGKQRNSRTFGYLMINPNLSIFEAKEEFARKRRTLMSDFLSIEAAEALHECMTQQLSWELVFRRGKEVITLDKDEMISMGPQGQQTLLNNVIQQARNDFQFLYWKHSMVDAYRRNLSPDLFTHRLLECLASQETIELIKTITGNGDIRRVDAQATMFQPGNFLTQHNDEQHGQFTRRVAYVINMCADWRADWGGLLHFLDERGAVSETFTPRFNTLSLFAVPQPHAVSCIASFSPRPRLSITGWFTA